MFRRAWDWAYWKGLDIALCLTVGTAVVLGLLLGGWFYADRHSCRREADAMSREWRYGWAEGCLVKLSDGTWVDIDKYRLADEESGR